ncbi:uncharacterized protein LOC132282580 [Cornus florida]|uniref:uncharacterized protein LOC132282580 n=1 Tax=Cornus florida TaxID=4283 RepID=UPI002896B8E0|nr:uncharacterized protein LOC132282580 [Cornus florida]
MHENALGGRLDERYGVELQGKVLERIYKPPPEGQEEQYLDSDKEDEFFYNLHEFALADGEIETANEFENATNLLINFVLRLFPAKCLMWLMKVSPAWHYYLGSPIFQHTQSYMCKEVCGYFSQVGKNPPTFSALLDHHDYRIPSPNLNFLAEPFEVRSSCSGLLLCQRENGFIICNPVTTKSRSPFQNQLMLLLVKLLS